MGEHFSHSVRHSSQGLRDRVYPLERVPGFRRILILGDSQVWCWGVEEEDCFVTVIEDRLNRTEVIAMGVPGYGTGQEWLLYRDRGRRFRPDLVIVAMTANDPLDNLEDRIRPRFIPGPRGLELTNVPVPGRKGALKVWLTRHSRLFAQARYALQILHGAWRSLRHGTLELGRDDDTPWFEQVEPAREAEAGQVTEAILDAIRAAAEADGGRLALTSFGPEAFADRVLAMAARKGLPALDLDRALRDAAARGIDCQLQGDPHLSPAGNEVVAEAIVAWLQQEFLATTAAVP